MEQPHLAVVPSGPSNEFDDCPRAWIRAANAANTRAVRWLDNVVAGLSRVPTPMPAALQRSLNDHFHTTDAEDIEEIRENFGEIREAYTESIGFECETSCDDNVAAYVYAIWSDVHLCPIWFRSPDWRQTETIIHELAHEYAGRDDEAYVWQREYKTLDSDDAIDNADSYSAFARDSWFGTRHPDL